MLVFPPELAIFHSSSEDDTTEYGRRLAAALPRPAEILLTGELGSGKTVVTKGLAEGLGVAPADEVVSPTYTLVHEYKNSRVTLFHIDLYRLDKISEVSTLGLEDVLDPAICDPPVVVVIEWGKKFNIFVDRLRLEVDLQLISENQRLIRAQWMQPAGIGQSADTLPTVVTSK
jgi:tRNA threonylcarbamoyladenosine biosynthesis protein TsaE